MKLKFKLAALAAVTAGCLLFACGDDESTSTTVSTTNTTTTTNTTGPGGGGGAGGGGGGFPAVPTMGAQVDRMGRAGVNTALLEAFISDTGTVSVDADRGAAQDSYNSNADPSTWGAQYLETVRQNLAVLDAVNGTCGDQVGFGALGNPNYTTLATVLINDWLVVKGNATSCASYLGVEVNALGLSTADDCGGRRPGDDTIDATYGVVAGVPTGFPDGVAAGPQSMVTTFPYLAAPN
jgi:hypothetical protein